MSAVPDPYGGDVNDPDPADPADPADRLSGGPDSIVGFYDAWAVDYDAAHADWRASVVAQGALLADALALRGVGPAQRVLDCTCGIGTQAIGLALNGYTVCGSDISSAEVERARREASNFDVTAEFAVADLLRLSSSLPPSWHAFDVVLSANSLTHLPDEATLIAAFVQMAEVCRPGGIIAVTNRDYDDHNHDDDRDSADRDSAERPISTPVQLSVVADVRRASFQLWEWADDGRSYRMEDVLLTRPVAEPAVPWTARSRSTTLYAWRRADIERAATAAGLTDIEWTHPQQAHPQQAHPQQTHPQQTHPQKPWQPIATMHTPEKLLRALSSPIQAVALWGVGAVGGLNAGAHTRSGSQVVTAEVASIPA